MFQERLRQQGAAAQGMPPPPRDSAGGMPGPPPSGLKLRMPQVGMPPRVPRPRVQTPTTPEHFEPMMRGQLPPGPLQQQQQQQLRANMPPRPRMPGMVPNRPPEHGPLAGGQPPHRGAAPVRPTAGLEKAGAGLPHAKGHEDDQLEDLLSECSLSPSFSTTRRYIFR